MSGGVVYFDWAGLMTYRMSGECVRVEQAAMGLMSGSVHCASSKR